ncbi:MAG TPA: ABC transporter ATP-binding protein [Anaerolineales bacterium]|nr:ABC transporter ATP-binding protein [Anaerolineales bacterium]
MTNPTDTAILTENLGRIYKLRNTKKGENTERVALEGVSLQVNRGELFGLLGPNGAGKSTLIKILVTLLAPSSGKAFVAGHDVWAEAQAIRPKINMVSGGESVGYGLLTVEENLWMFSQFYGLDNGAARRRIKELMTQVGMADRLKSKSSDLSTGLRQKMNIVRGFLTDPEILFLDEPTLGLDVNAGLQIRELVRGWMKQHPERSILLTTHYMMEADDLCDRIAIIDQGKVLACDTPTNLKRTLQKDAIFHLQTTPLGEKAQQLAGVSGIHKFTHTAQDGSDTLEMILQAEDALGNVISTINQAGAQLLNLSKREATLEDVFIHLVGRSLSDATQ